MLALGYHVIHGAQDNVAPTTVLEAASGGGVPIPEVDGEAPDIVPPATAAPGQKHMQP